MILLDTNAAIWLAQGHLGTRALERFPRLYLSPASVLELQFLAEAGRVRLSAGLSVTALADDPRWVLDDVPSARWFEAAAEVGWTRDPFDRLIVAHARVRGWRLATSDPTLVERLSSGEVMPL